jgi:hypothetical protein
MASLPKCQLYVDRELQKQQWSDVHMQSFREFRYFMFLCLLFLCEIGFMSDGVLLTKHEG